MAEDFAYPHHKVKLFREDGEQVGSFMFPPTDPRFVKHDGIGQVAAERAKETTNPKWDYLMVSFYSATIVADTEGNLIAMK